MWDIGIPAFLEPEPDLWVVTEDDVNIPGRRVDDHKYRAGYVAVLAGSKAYPGAAWLASQAAYRTGSGIRPPADAGRGRGEHAEPARGDGARGDRATVTSLTTPGGSWR